MLKLRIHHFLGLVSLGVCGAAPAGEQSAGDPDWWSRQPLARPPVPEIVGPEARRARTPVDRFVIARLGESGLTLSPEADRSTLIRRLYFDLIGLPPSPREVADFVRDPDPEAYSRLVERLLDSKRHGERWARHWLDVVHYGESHGYDKDKPRPNAWPYRDYVIRSFNEDKPYARFVKEQIAGDVLWPDTADGIVATGFIAAGPWDFIGHAEVPEEKIDGKVARHLDRDDMVTATMNAFCSITVQCAQCHDHKRDPVTMEDYYSLQAVFSALDRADRPYDPDPQTAARRAALTAQIAEAEETIENLDQRIEEAKTANIRNLEERIAKLEKTLAAAGEIEGEQRSDRFGYHSRVAASQDTEKWVQVDLGREAAIDSVALFGADEYGFADFGFPHRFRVEVSTEPGFTQARTLTRHEDSDCPRPGASPVVVAGHAAVGRYVRVTATKLWSRRQKGHPPGDDWIFALGELAVIAGGATVEIGSVTALDSIESLPRWGKENLVDGIYGRYPLAARAPEGIVAWLQEDAGEKRNELDDLAARRDAALRTVASDAVTNRERQTTTVAGLRARLEKLPQPQMVYAGTVHAGSGAFRGRGHLGGKPREIFVLNRGSVTRPGAPVNPGTVPGIVPGAPAEFFLPPDHEEGARRVALAEWITHPENTLTWRSIVNRVWQYHFGRGIVDTPNDFGRIGEQPSHPELLDWLAVEFRDGGGSMKNLHRLILDSAVYRQSSAHRPSAAEIDGSNRYLWRQNRRRLEAEAVRDTVLAVSGKLDLRMGGPSFMDFVIEKPEHSPHYQYDKSDPDDPATHRRSVYRFLVRSQPQPFMDTLDCADPSQLVDKRGETNTALQALAMLNNPFMVRMAEHFAARVEAEAEADPAGRALELALSRPATGGERAMVREYADQHGLPAACRLIFSLNEFSFVD